MSICFTCDAKLDSECTRVCSSVTPYSDVPYPEKIAELLGDEVVVIITPTDQMCKKCTSLLTHFDKLENDLRLVKSTIMSYIQKKYGLLPPDQAVQDVNIVNGHLMAAKPVEQGQSKVPNGLTLGVSPTVTTAVVVKPVQTPSKLLMTQQQQHQQQPQQEQQQQKQLPIQQKSAKKMILYKCGFCMYTSKELGHVRFHIRTSHFKKEPEKSFPNQATAKASTSAPKMKKTSYRCTVCSISFESHGKCLGHIQKEHYQLTPSTSNAERGTEDCRQVTTKVTTPEPPKTQENNQQAKSSMKVDKNPQDSNKSTSNTVLMLNDYVPPTEVSADVEQAEETENSQEDKTEK